MLVPSVSLILLAYIFTSSHTVAFAPYKRSISILTDPITAAGSAPVSSVASRSASFVSATGINSSSTSVVLTTGPIVDATPSSSSSSELPITSSPTSVSSVTDSDVAGSPIITSSTTGTGATVVPSTIKATDGSDRTTVVAWSAVETGSTSTTDDNGQPTVIPAPFYICNDPLCANTGCMLAILCSSRGGSIGFGGFPSPEPPLGTLEDNGGDKPSDSASQSKSTPTSASSQSSGSSSITTASSSSSTSSSSRTCGGAITTVIDPGPTSAGDPDDGRRRLIRGMFKSKDFIAAKREQPPAITRIGDCNLAKEVKIPQYLGFGKAMKLQNQMKGHGGANGRIYNAIEKWYPEHLTINGDPFEGAKENSNSFTGNVPGSIDHVWEKSNVVDFLTSVLGDDFDCDDLNALFFACKKNILQTIFNQLPSMDKENLQAGFAAMNRNLNGMKGWMFSRGFEDSKFGGLYNEPSKVIQGLQRQAIIFDLFRSDAGIQTMHDQTNNRIYGAFLALDNHISDNKIQRANDRGDLTQTFGPTFRAWYENLLDDVGEATYKWANDQVTIINTELNKNPDSDCDLRKAAIAFQASPLYGEAEFKLDQSHLKWSASEVLIGRSLFGRAGTCTGLNTISHTLTTSASPTPSTPPPMTINGPHCAAVSNNPTGGKHCGFKDIHTKDVNAEAKMFEIGEPSDMTPDSQNHTEVIRGNAKVALIMNVGWIPGCTVYGSQSSLNPLGYAGDDTISYRTLLKDAYRNCTDNRGLGGYWDVGCLRYGFYPTRIPDVFTDDGNTHTELYWQQGTYCPRP